MFSRKVKSLLQINLNYNCFIVEAIVIIILGTCAFDIFIGQERDPVTYIAAATLICTILFGIRLQPIHTFIKKIFAIRRDASLTDQTEPKPEIQWITRDSQLKNLKKLLGENSIVILSGESGSGKSTLINQLTTQNTDQSTTQNKEQPKWKIRYRRDRYVSHWSKDLESEEKDRESEEVHLFIFDQFELALDDMDEIATCLKSIMDVSNKKVLFCLPVDGFGALVRAINTCESRIERKIPYGYMFLTYDEQDKKKLMEHTLQSLGLRPNLNIDAMQPSHLKQFLLSIQTEIFNNRLLFIVWSLIIHMRNRFNNETIINTYIENRHSLAALMDRIIETQIQSLSHPEIGEEILYLLSRDSKSQYSINVSDFKRLTFRKDEEINQTISELVEINYISHVEGTNNTESREFEISHEFLAKRLQVYGNYHLGAEILKNINQFGPLHMRGQRGVYEALNYNRVYTAYYDETHLWWNRVCLEFVLVLLIGLHVCYYILPILEPVPEWAASIGYFQIDLTTKVLLLLSLGGSIFYVHNFCFHYFRFSKKHTNIVQVIGILMICACLIWPQMWPVFLGIEVGCVGCTLICTQKYAIAQERDTLKFQGLTYIMCGALIIWVGCTFSVWGKVYHIIGFFMYAVFLTGAYVGHLKYDFMFGLLGKLDGNAKV